MGRCIKETLFVGVVELAQGYVSCLRFDPCVMNSNHELPIERAVKRELNE